MTDDLIDSKVLSNTDVVNDKEFEEDLMLTTLDNPYNPFIQYDEWYAFDVAKGYNTCAYLARVTSTSDEISEKDQDLALESAINDILRLNIIGKYITVTRDFKPHINPQSK